MRISKSHARGQHNYYHSQKVRERTPAILTQMRRPAPNELAPAPFGVIFCLKKSVFVFSFDFFFFDIFLVSSKTYPCVYCNCCLVVVLLSSRDGLTRSSLPFSKFVDFEFSSTRDDPIEFFSLSCMTNY